MVMEIYLSFYWENFIFILLKKQDFDYLGQFWWPLFFDFENFMDMGGLVNNQWLML